MQRRCDTWDLLGDCGQVTICPDVSPHGCPRVSGKTLLSIWWGELGRWAGEPNPLVVPGPRGLWVPLGCSPLPRPGLLCAKMLFLPELPSRRKILQREALQACMEMVQLHQDLGGSCKGCGGSVGTEPQSRGTCGAERLCGPIRGFTLKRV